MANYNKSFNFKNGVQVDTDNFLVNQNGLVGIGSTSPSEFLDVVGNTKVSGLTTTNLLYAGIGTVSNFGATDAEITNLEVTSLTIGGVTASELIGFSTAAWITGRAYPDSNPLSGLTTTSNIGIGTTQALQDYEFLVVGSPELNQDGFTINVHGEVRASGIITAAGFSGVGENLTTLNASNISSGTLNNDRLPQDITVSGNIRADGATGFIGIANTARSLTDTPDIAVNDITASSVSGAAATFTSLDLSDGVITDVDSIELNTGSITGVSNISAMGYISGITTMDVGGIELRDSGPISGIGTLTAVRIVTTTANVGHATVTDVLHLDSANIGIGTDTPTSDIQIVEASGAKIEVTSLTGESSIELGQNVGGGNSTATIRFGNQDGTLDILNNDSGDIRMVLDATPAGINTGNFNWYYNSTANIPLMSLSYEGTLGINDTAPSEKVSVGGGLTASGNSFFGSDVTIKGDLTADNINGNGSGLTNLNLPNPLPRRVYHTTGISTVSQLHVVDTVTQGNVSGIASVGINTDNPIVGLDAANADAILRRVAIGRTEDVENLSGTQGIQLYYRNHDIFGGNLRIFTRPNESFVPNGGGSIVANREQPRSIFDLGDAASGPLAGVGYSGGCFIPPQLTNAQRDELKDQSIPLGAGTTVVGSFIFNTDTSQFQGYTGTGWTSLAVDAQGTYNDGAVDAHLNTGSATANQVLSWTGSDYDWVAQTGGGSIVGINTEFTSFFNQISASGIVTASMFCKIGGASNEFLKADGSVDSSTYATTAAVGLATNGLLDNAGVDSHLNTGSANNEEVLSWNGSDYEWVSNSVSDTGISTTGDSFFNNVNISGITTIGIASVRSLKVGPDNTIVGPDGQLAVVNTTGTASLTVGQNVDGSGQQHLGVQYGNNEALVFTSNGDMRFVVDAAGGGFVPVAQQGSIEFGSNGNLAGDADVEINSIDVATGVSTTLLVRGDARITGILTVGTSSVAIDGERDEIRIGNNVTLTSSGEAEYSGIVTASAFSGDLSEGTAGKWTLGATGTSHYQFTGPGVSDAAEDPTIYVLRGRRYEFVNNMGAHPFEIRTSINGSAYAPADGLTNNGVSNGTLTWDVRFDAPDILYYQCTAHPSMVGQITVVGNDTTGGAGNIAGINTLGTSHFNDVNVGGALTASTFTGSGSGLTNVPSAQLTGALPAIDASNVTGIVTSIIAGTNITLGENGGNITINSTGGGSGTGNFATKNVNAYTATASQTTFAGVYELGFVDVYINGVKLSASEYTATNGTSIVLNTGATLGDVVEVIGLQSVLGGVQIRDNDTVIGTAGTINFGSNLSVSDVVSGIVTVTATGGGGALQSRTTVSGTTASLADNAIGNIDITGFKSYSLMKVGLSTAGWFRLYTDSASRTADAGRSIGEDPIPGSGVIAEVVTTGISTQQMISPFVMGGNMDDPVTTTMYVAIQNTSGETKTITANLTILKLED